MDSSWLSNWAWAIQLGSCFYMTGLILLIQFVHYPSFAQIERSQFSGFHTRHSKILGYIVGPVMVAELLSGLWLALDGSLWLLINLALIIFLWLVTFLLSVPAHHRLSQGFDELAWKRLVNTNWLRTVIWTLRSLIFLVFMAKGPHL